MSDHDRQAMEAEARAMLAVTAVRVDAAAEAAVAAHPLDAADLAEALAKMVTADGWYVRLAGHATEIGALKARVAGLDLPARALGYLALARAERPALYRHSLGVAVVAYYLAARLKLKTATIDHVLAAALCHDLGELQINPAIMNATHRVSEGERRFLYLHPLVGWLMLRDMPGFPAEAAEAVRQHQERLDGSGYPFGAKDEEISLAGRLLAAADVAETIMTRFADHHRLTTLLRLNQKKYDRNVVGLLHEAVGPEAAPAPEMARGMLAARTAGFAAVVEHWGRLRGEPGVARAIKGGFLAERMFNLRMVVTQFGFDPDSLAMSVKLAEEDPVIAAELATVIDELQFQLAELGQEFDRRAPAWLRSLDPAVATALAGWRRQLQECVGQAA